MNITEHMTIQQYHHLAATGEPIEGLEPDAKPKRHLKKEEDRESTAFANYLDDLVEFGKIEIFSHAANENRNRLDAFKNSRLGVRKGLLDFWILTKTKLIVVEMKKLDGGKTSKEQKIWVEGLKRLGIPVSVCNGNLEARKFVESQL